MQLQVSFSPVYYKMSYGTPNLDSNIGLLHHSHSNMDQVIKPTNKEEFVGSRNR